MKAVSLAPRRHSYPASHSAVLAFVLIASVTLLPVDGNPVQRPFWCLVCGDNGVADVIRNVVLFVPYGVSLRAAGMRRGGVVGLVLATTVMVELLQYRVIPGREGTLSDVMTNVLGGTLGIAIADSGRSLLWPTRRQATWLAAASSAAVLSVMVLTLAAFQVAIPCGALVSEWAPTRSPMVPLRGKVESIVVNDRALHNGELVDGDVLRRGGTGPLHVDTQISIRGIANLPAAIMRLGTEHDDAVSLAVRGRDVMFTPGMRASRWHLNPVRVVLAEGVPTPSGSGGVSVRIWAAVGGDKLRVGSQAGASAHAASVTISPALTWSLLTPFYYALGSTYRLISMLWMVALLTPVGYWSAWAADSQRGVTGRLRLVSLVPCAMALAGLAAIPTVMGYSIPPWTDWAAAGGGAVGGWLLGTRNLTGRRFAV